MKWNNITLNQFKEIQEILKIDDELERIVRLSEVVFGDTITELPIQEYNKKLKELAFLQTEIPTNHNIKSVTVNNRKYNIDGLLGNITTAQYIDYVNNSKQGDTAKVLSVFFIPDGHKYNDGYDMLEVINDMGCLPIDIVTSTAFFFKRQLQEFIRIFQYSLKKKVKKMKVTENQKQLMMDLAKPLEYYLTF